MGEFTRPVEELGKSAKTYADLRFEDIKLRLVKSLSYSLGRLLSMVVLLFVCSIVFLALAIGLILIIGKAIDNYAVGAFIVAGVFAVIAAILYALRKVLFVSSFVEIMQDLGKVSSLKELEKEQIKVSEEIHRKEDEISYRIDGLKETYSPANLFLSGLRKTGGDVAIISILHKIREFLTRQA